MGIVASQPARERRLRDGVEILEWPPSGRDPSGSIALIPGWGAHPRLYGEIIRALNDANLLVAAPWARPVGGATSDAHYRALPEFVGDLRQRGVAVGFLAESLGATYLLASSVLDRRDRAVLISPALFLRMQQVMSAPALRDLGSLLLENRAPITTWRLDSITDDPAFAEAARSGLVAPFSDRSYVRRAVQASIKAALRPDRSDHMWIIRGEEDQLLSPVGAWWLAHKLRDVHPRVTAVSEAAHGVLWDRGRSSLLLTEIASFLSDE